LVRVIKSKLGTMYTPRTKEENYIIKGSEGANIEPTSDKKTQTPQYIKSTPIILSRG